MTLISRPAKSMNPTFEAARLLRVLVAYFMLFATFALVALRVPVSDHFLPAFFSAWIGACVGIALVYLFSRGPDDNWTLWKVIAGGMTLDVLCNFSALNLLSATGVLRLVLIGFGNLGILAAAIGIGLLVARGLKQPNYLIMAAIVGAVTDIFSVYLGPSKHLITSEVFPYVAYQWGLIGQGDILPCVGAGDFIFMTLYFAGARRFGLNARKTYVAMCVALAIGYLSLLVSPNGIPALPFMAVLLLLVHGRELKAQMK